MRTFTQSLPQSQKPVSASLAQPFSVTPGPALSRPLLLPLQDTSANQVEHERARTLAEESQAGLTGTAALQVRYDFGRLPVYPPAPGAIQTKLAITTPGDVYEQQADRLAEQMIRMPEPQDVSPHQGDRKRPQQAGVPERGDEEKHDQLARQELSRTSGPTLTGAPAIVQAVLSSPGQPLDAATRGFFESRFGHDFGHVRIHADGLAADSARVVEAQAYTVTHHIVFGPSQYSPSTLAGRKLLAHELTHVVQQVTASHQLRPGDFAPAAVGSISSGALLRKPDKPTSAERRREQRLEDLARDPGEAHQAWKRLSEEERSAVVQRMQQRYGGPFAQQFLEEVKKGKPQTGILHYARGVGPQPSELSKQGYQRGWTQHIAADMALEWWVHPSGRYITRDVGTWKPGTAETTKEPGPKAPQPRYRPPTKPKRPCRLWMKTKSRRWTYSMTCNSETTSYRMPWPLIPLTRRKPRRHRRSGPSPARNCAI